MTDRKMSILGFLLVRKAFADTFYCIIKWIWHNGGFRFSVKTDAKKEKNNAKMRFVYKMFTFCRKYLKKCI